MEQMKVTEILKQNAHSHLPGFIVAEVSEFVPYRIIGYVHSFNEATRLYEQACKASEHPGAIHIFNQLSEEW